MVKLFLPLISLFSLAFLQTPPSETFREHLHTVENSRGNNTLVSVDSYSENGEFRIYHYDNLVIDEVDDNAFHGTNFKTLVLTNSVKYISDSAFENAENIKNLFFTGSEEEFKALNLTHSFDAVKFYYADEGFMNFWSEVVRPNKDANICDISINQYEFVYNLYISLNNTDKSVVDSSIDLAGSKISDSMKELINKFHVEPNNQNSDEWNQTGAITLIIFIAVLGMTFISIFYLFKTKHIIE